MLTVKALRESEALRTIIVPLVVPTAKEVINSVLNSQNLDLSKSDLNACYSKPPVNKKNGKKQSWYDVKLTVGSQDNLPSRKEWFYMATDDGYVFKACFVGKKIKKLSTFENKEIIGMWIKNRLVEWDVLAGFKFVFQDPRRTGVVTKEALDSYGGDTIFIKKTKKTKRDSNGIKRSVWFMSFPYRLYSERQEAISQKNKKF